MSFLKIALLFTFFISLSCASYAETHKDITSSRSSTMNNIYVNQAVTKMSGVLNKNEVKLNESDSGPSMERVNSQWNGFGISNSVGVESQKFYRIGLSHTFLNLQSSNNGLETFIGSKIGAEAKLIFTAPVVNFVTGMAGTLSYMTLRSSSSSASYVGVGTYTSIGFERFMTPRQSFFTEARIHKESLNQNSVSNNSSGVINSKMKTIDMGISIWL